MPFAQDEAGQWWEVDAAGNPIAPAGAAASPQGRVFTLPRNPKEVAAEARQAAQDARQSNRDAQGDADRAADNARADRSLALQEAAAAQKAAEANPVLSPDERNEVAAEASQKIKLIDSLIERSRNGWFATGFGANTAAMIPGTTARDVANDVQTVSASGALQRIMEMARTNGGKNPLTPLSNADFQALGQSIANLDPSQSDEQFQRNLLVYRDIYQRALGAAGGEVTGQQAEDEVAKAAAFNDPSPPDLPPANQGGNDPTPWDGPNSGAPRVATGDYRTVSKPEVASKAFSMLRAGAGYSTIKAALGSDGAGFTMAAFSEAKKRLATNPNVNPFVFQQDIPTTLMQRAAGSDWGAAGIGAGNAVAMGGLDELTGAINSVANGTSYLSERDKAQGAKEAAQALNPGAYFAGELGSGLTTGLVAGGALAGTRAAQALSSIPGVLGTGAAYGGATGALESNDDRLLGGLIGGGAGMLAGLAGRYGIAPVAERIGRLRGNAPTIAAQENALPNIPDSVMTNLEDAQRLNLPYALADADPALRALAGTVSRKSPNARALAEAIFEPRARGQADRVIDLADRELAPITDINARASDIIKGGNIEAGPYYARAKAQGAMDDPIVGSILNTSSGKDALRRAFRIASDERRDPSQLGFIYDEATGGVRINDDMPGRYSTDRGPAPAHERGVIAGRGRRAPADLVTFVRQNGGLVNQAGELSHMGATNAARKGVPFAGQDEKWGPLVSETGRKYDEMGEAAWEAGYFDERPTVTEFLDALRGTLDGERRLFHPEDQGVVDDYFNAQADRYRWINSEGKVSDTSQPVGPDVPFAPPGAYGEEVALPTYETLHYVRQGFDDILDGYRDKVTGKVQLDNEGRAIANLRRDLSDRLQQNPDFRQGDAIYSNAAKRRDALQDGHGVLSNNGVPFRDFEARLSQARAYDDDFRLPEQRLVPEMQRGFATNMADAANKTRLSGNPWEAVYGAPVQQQKIDALFPEGAANFGRAYTLERDMSRTAYETIGGSPTAARLAADQQMGDLVSSGLEIGADLVTGGGASGLGAIVNTGRRMLGDSIKLGIGKRAEANADKIAPVLFGTNPDAALQYLIDLGARKAAMQGRKQDYGGRGALLGAILAPSLLPTGG